MLSSSNTVNTGEHQYLNSMDTTSNANKLSLNSTDIDYIPVFLIIFYIQHRLNSINPNNNSGRFNKTSKM